MKGRRSTAAPLADSLRPWGEYDLADDRITAVDIGPLRLHLRVQKGEVWIAHTRSSEGEHPAEEDLSWMRWAAREPVGSVRLVPVFPDRPLVVAPEIPFKMAPGAEARIYVRAPLWVRVEHPGSREAVLMEAPTMVLSDTWWGDFLDGELGYWLHTKARRGLDESHFEPFLVMCPLALANRSSEVLDVEKLAVRVQYMSIYRKGTKLWSDETTVRYESEAEGSEIDTAGEPPPEARDAELVTPPRMASARGFRARTFARIISLSGI